MAELQVQVCGSPWKVVKPEGDSVFNADQIAKIKVQIAVLEDMKILLELRDLVLAFCDKYEAIYRAELIRLTRARGRDDNEKYENAERKATQTQRNQADAKAMATDGDPHALILKVKEKKGELKGESLASWKYDPDNPSKPAGVLPALQQLLGKISEAQRTLAGKLDQDTMAALRQCDTSWNDTQPMALKVSTLVAVKTALEEFLRLKLEVKPFALLPASTDAVRTEAVSGLTPPVEPEDWSAKMADWIRHRAWFPNFRLSVGGNAVVEDSGLSLDRARLGEPANMDQNATGAVTGSADVAWDHLPSVGGYHLEPHILYTGSGEGFGGEQIQRHRIGGMLLGRPDDAGSYYPSFALLGEYQLNDTEVPNPPHLQERGLRLSVLANEQLYRWQAGHRLSLDLGDDITGFGVGDLGTRNGLSFLRNTASTGLRYSFPNATVPFTLAVGARHIYESQELRFNPFTPEGSNQYNTGWGGYFNGALDFRRGGLLNLSLTYDHMAKFVDPIYASVMYQNYFRAGTLWRPYLRVDYSRVSVGNGTEHLVTPTAGAQVLLTGDPQNYALYLDLHYTAQYQQVDRDRAAAGIGGSSGLVHIPGVGLTFGFGGGSRPAAHDTQQAVAPSTAQLEADYYRRRALTRPDEQIYSNPASVNSVSRDSDAANRAAYLILWKQGRLDGYRSAVAGFTDKTLREAAKSVDGGPTAAGAGAYSMYGYRPENGDKVLEGDVAPIAFYVGGQKIAGQPDEQLSDYYDDIYNLNPASTETVDGRTIVIRSTEDVLGIGKARRDLLSSGAAVGASNGGTFIAEDLLFAVADMYSKGDVKNEALKAELSAMEVGPEVMKAAKEMLKAALKKAKGAELTSAEISSIDNLRSLTRKLVDVLTAYAALVYNNIDTQKLPEFAAFTQMITDAGSPAAPPPPPAPAPAPGDVADTPAEAAQRQVATAAGRPFKNEREAKRDGDVVPNPAKPTEFIPKPGFEWVDDSSRLNWAVKPKP